MNIGSVGQVLKAAVTVSVKAAKRAGRFAKALGSKG